MLTDRKIVSLKPKETRYEIADENDHGRGTLVLRVSPTGTKTFVFRYSIERKVRRLTLGEYGIGNEQLTLAMARAKCAEAVKHLESGIDPGALEQNRKTEAANAPTITVLAEEYLEKWAKPRKRSWREDERILKKDIIPAWGERKARSVTRRDIVVLLDLIATRGAPIAANRTLALVRKMFSFAVSRSMIDLSPCLGIQAPAKERQKDRVLSDEEIARFWTGLESASMSLVTKLALQFMLITGQRLGEVTQLERGQIEGGWWTIPASIAKNGRAHRVPLSTLAIEILDQARVISGHRYLFSSPRPNGDADRPMSPTALSHALRKNLEIMDLAQFTPHDLRRTAATHIGMMGHNRLVISKILNHVEGGVTAIYDRHTYDNEKREALEDWSRKLKQIITILQ